MRALLRAGLLALLVWAPACVIQLDGNDPDRLDEAIRDTAAEVSLHHATLTGASTMDDVVGELTRHEAAMDDRLRAMRRELDDGSCADHGMDAMRSMEDQLESREAAYAAEMAAATTVAAALAACETYGDDMDELLGRMMNRWNLMGCETGW